MNIPEAFFSAGSAEAGAGASEAGAPVPTAIKNMAP